MSTGMEFVDQISQPEMFAPRPRETALSFSSETTIPMPNSLWPVTILLTSNVTVAPPARFDHVQRLQLASYRNSTVDNRIDPIRRWRLDDSVGQKLGRSTILA